MNNLENNLPTIELDLIQTLAVASIIFFIGMVIRKRITFLERLNIPSAVVGGLLFAVLHLTIHDRFFIVKFTTSAQPLFMVLFFTTIGMGASLPLLKRGGLSVIIFLLISILFCFLQNAIGMGIASLFNVNPLLGVIAGSVTLVGGPATGLAFAPLFEQAGVVGAHTVAITAATFGIICGGILGGPAGTHLIRRHHLTSRGTGEQNELQHELNPEPLIVRIDTEREDSNLMMNILIAAAIMGVGSVVSFYFQSAGWTLPAYIGAMLVASVVRNIDDKTRWINIDHSVMELIGTISLNIFLVVALMDLKLWELVHLALPLATILLFQVIAVVFFAIFVSFRMMGKDYESAVMAGGFIGFVLGTAANAMANMKTLVSKFGPAPRAFLVVPLVGTFFIDVINAIIITLFLNWLR